MQTLNELETAPIPLEEEEQRHTRRLLAGLLFALLLTGLVFGGYLLLRKRHGGEVASAAAAANTKLPPKVEIYVDQAMLKDKDTILGGTIHNISKEPLHGLAVELELKRRDGAGLETKAVPLDEANLLPDASAHYSLTLSAKDYLTARLLGVVAGEKREAVGYKVLDGLPRPLATPVPGKTVTVQRPKSRNGGGFLNSPDRPERVP